jgi:hypothetical protein
MEVARQRFVRLGMAQTAARNGVLFYLATEDGRFAVFGDEGIHQRVGDPFWQALRDRMAERFRRGEFVLGLTEGHWSRGRAPGRRPSRAPRTIATSFRTPSPGRRGSGRTRMPSARTRERTCTPSSRKAPPPPGRRRRAGRTRGSGGRGGPRHVLVRVQRAAAGLRGTGSGDARPIPERSRGARRSRRSRDRGGRGTARSCQRRGARSWDRSPPPAPPCAEAGRCAWF